MKKLVIYRLEGGMKMKNQTVGNIVSQLPKASELFKQYKIDFCCGGDKPLGEVIRQQNINEEELLEKLDVLSKEKDSINTPDFINMSSSELIDYIVNTHHVFVRNILPELNGLIVKILQVHGINHQELFKVHQHFSLLKLELEQHLIKEEEILFPLIKEYDKNQSNKIFEVMEETEDEHETAGNVLKELRKITNDYQVPKDGCTTYFITYKKLQELESDLFQHIHLENNILFKRLSKN